MSVSLTRVRARVMADFHGDPESIHGPEHWARVEKVGLRLAAETGSDKTVVRLFALFHDACRENDDDDPGHGARGAAYAERLRGEGVFTLSDTAMGLLVEACRGHTDGELSTDPTIGTCWDADRLDLGRVGMRPSARYMSTEAGRKLAHRRRAAFPG